MFRSIVIASILCLLSGNVWGQEREKGPLSEATHAILTEHPKRVLGVDGQRKSLATIKPVGSAVLLKGRELLHALASAKPEAKFGYSYGSDDWPRWTLWILGPGRKKAEFSLSMDSKRADYRAMAKLVEPAATRLATAPTHLLVDVEIEGVDPNTAITRFAASGYKLAQLAWHATNFGQPYAEIALDRSVKMDGSGLEIDTFAETLLNDEIERIMKLVRDRYPHERIKWRGGSSSQTEYGQTYEVFFPYGTSLRGLRQVLLQYDASVWKLNDDPTYPLQMMIPAGQIKQTAKSLKAEFRFVRGLTPHRPKLSKY